PVLARQPRATAGRAVPGPSRRRRQRGVAPRAARGGAMIALQRRRPDASAARRSLTALDERHPVPEAVRVLDRPGTEPLLAYVSHDAFGSHVFPGDRPAPAAEFLADLDAELATGAPYFLWATIPICRYHCLYCQFPIVVQPRGDDAG